MCSIIVNKINKDLISIIREYLLPLNVKEKYSEVISVRVLHERFNDNLSELLRKCYLFKMKRRFPQKEYIVDRYNQMIFSIPNLSDIRDNDHIFTENTHINSYISTQRWFSSILFHLE